MIKTRSNSMKHLKKSAFSECEGVEIGSGCYRPVGFEFDEVYLEEFLYYGTKIIQIRPKAENKHKNCKGVVKTLGQPLDSFFIKDLKEGKFFGSVSYSRRPISGFTVDTKSATNEICFAFTKDALFLDDIWKFVPGVPTDTESQDHLPSLYYSEKEKKYYYQPLEKHNHHYVIPFARIEKIEYKDNLIGRDSIKFILKSNIENTERRLLITFVLPKGYSKYSNNIKDNLNNIMKISDSWKEGLDIYNELKMKYYVESINKLIDDDIFHLYNIYFQDKQKKENEDKDLSLDDDYLMYFYNQIIDSGKYDKYKEYDNIDKAVEETGY